MLGTFLANKEADFYKLDKIEKMIYSYFVGSPKRIRFAAGDVNIRYEVNKKILNIKRKMLDEGLIIGKFNPKILLGYFLRLVLLTILEALVIFIYLIPFEDEKFIFQEPEKNLKRYLVSRMDFLRILGNW